MFKQTERMFGIEWQKSTNARKVNARKFVSCVKKTTQFSMKINIQKCTQDTSFLCLTFCFEKILLTFGRHWKLSVCFMIHNIRICHNLWQHQWNRNIISITLSTSSNLVLPMHLTFVVSFEIYICFSLCLTIQDQ